VLSHKWKHGQKFLDTQTKCVITITSIWYKRKKGGGDDLRYSLRSEDGKSKLRGQNWIIQQIEQKKLEEI